MTGTNGQPCSGCGIISVPIEQQRDFTATLVQFYESNDMEPLKAFVYNYCIDGIAFEPAAESEADWKNGNNYEGVN